MNTKCRRFALVLVIKRFSFLIYYHKKTATLFRRKCFNCNEMSVQYIQCIALANVYTNTVCSQNVTEPTIDKKNQQNKTS